MDTYSTANLKIRITLTEEQVSRLEREVIKGWIKVPHDIKRKKFYKRRPLELEKDGEREFPDASLELIPENSTPENFRKVIVKLSPMGYRQLKAIGYVFSSTRGEASEVEIIQENGLLQRHR